MGTVTKFKGDGRRLGYPTANITTATELADGVYFGFADLGELSRQPALIFIGIPTTMGEHDRRVEAHVLDIADQDYYDQSLVLDIRQFHRRNETFASVDSLKLAMAEDEQAARAWFTRHQADGPASG